jgi:hypothetical protein
MSWSFPRTPSCAHTSAFPLNFSFPTTTPRAEHRRCLGSPSTATAAASHPRSSAPRAPPRPTEAHKPAQFRSLAPKRPDHNAGELELPPPLGLAVVPSIHRLLAPAKYIISTTSSRRSSVATSPPLSCPPATETPMPPLGALPPAPVRHRYAASALLFPNTGHPQDRREPPNLSPHFPLAADEPPHRNLIGPDRVSCVARPRTQLQRFKIFQGPIYRKSEPPHSNQPTCKIHRTF